MRVVYCVGGLLDGQSFTEEDWQERVTAAKRTAPSRETPPAALGYEVGQVKDLTRPMPAILLDHTVVVMRWGRR